MKEKYLSLLYATPFRGDIVMGLLFYEKWILLYAKLLIKASGMKKKGIRKEIT